MQYLKQQSLDQPQPFTASVTPAAPLRRRVRPHQRLLRGRLLNLLQRMDGQLQFNDPELQLRLGQGNTAVAAGVDADLQVLDPAAYTRLALGGSVGAGEAYVDGQWCSQDLTGLLRYLLRNRQSLDPVDRGSAWLGRMQHALRHIGRRNNLAGSRKNIGAHYDLSNEFFALFLDPSMMYSAAIYETPADSLASASYNKLERICRKLDLQPSDHLLEIGTGWGGMAMHAARHYGCKVTTTTISQAQYEAAKARVQAAGLTAQIEVLPLDYRQLQGRYDKLVSVEMVEAIGHLQLQRYFACCDALLKPGGLMLLQAITIEDHRYRAALQLVDFIKAHVFPGSFVPAVSVLTQAAAARTRWRLVNLEDLGLDYARTLAHWRENFSAALPKVQALGFDQRFVRLWEYYLCYCEAGFAEQMISDVQMLFAKQGYHGQPWRASL